MNWILLVVAGIFEVAFAFCLGKSKGLYGAPWYGWIAAFLLCLSVSMYLLYIASRQIPMGTAYAVWTGIGAAGTVLVGIIMFREPGTFWRLFFITTLIASVVGLRLVSR